MKYPSSPVHRTAEKANRFRYIVTKFDEEGWADAERSLPIPFDLITLLTSTDKKIVGWWDGGAWDGYRLRPKDKIVKWKRRRYEIFN